MDTIINQPMVWAKKELGFEESDLIANRAGKYSEKQRIRAFRGGTSLIIFSLFAIIILFIVLIFTDPMFGHPVNWPDVIIKGILFTIFLVVFAYMGWRTRKSSQNNIIKSTSGVVTFSINKKEVIMKCGEISIEVEKKVMELFPNDKEYIFYYSDIDKTIISIAEKY